MTHDKFCPAGHGGQPCEDGAYCEAPCVCDEIAMARADEREQAAQRVNWALVKHLNQATPVVHIAVTAARGGEQA